MPREALGLLKPALEVFWTFIDRVHKTAGKRSALLDRR